MKILLINHYAGAPKYGMEYRPYYLAREWVRAGHKVKILTASFSHVRSQNPMVMKEVKPLGIDGIQYRFIPTTPYRGNGLGRLRNIAQFLWGVWKMREELAVKDLPDVVIASSTYPMDIWLARHIARMAHAKWVYEVHDLWPLSLIELSGMHPRHPFAQLCQKAENDAYRSADLVVSMLPKVHEHMAAHGLDLSRLHIVPNGISPQEWPQEGEVPDESVLPQPLRQWMAQQKAQGRLVVGYAGSHGLPNALHVLLEAAHGLREAPLAFVLVGSGHEKSALEAQARELALPHLLMHEPLPKACMPALMSLFDVAYLGWQPQPIYRFGIAPNKLLDYMMAGRPILHAVTAGNDPVAEAQCGLTVPAGDVPAVVAGFKALAAMPTAEREAMGARGRPYVLAHHSYPALAQRFIDAMQPLVGARLV
jgi:glycosyltransferase involved in cell wall biosynthesis